jgi:hypothetical protein
MRILRQSGSPSWVTSRTSIPKDWWGYSQHPIILRVAGVTLDRWNLQPAMAAPLCAFLREADDTPKQHEETES